MYKKIAKYVLSIAIIVIIISTVIMVYGITNKNSNENKISEKVLQEIDYLDLKLSDILMSLNNLSTNNLINSQVKLEQSDNKDTSSSEKNSENSEGTSSSESSKGGSSSSSENTNQTNSNKQQTATINTVDSKSIVLKERNNINWKYIQTEIGEVKNSWSVVVIDLNSIDKTNENILKFNGILDETIKSAKANDKTKTLGYVANMYELLPQYMKIASANSPKIEYKKIKSDILSSYALLEVSQWNNIYKLLGDADKTLSGIMNNTDKNLSKEQKIYVLLKDYIKSANDKDTELCYIKVYYLMKELENV